MTRQRPGCGFPVLKFLLLFSFMIPISLKLTLDLCKLFYAKFIDADLELEARCGVKVPVIFEIEGESGFRNREAIVLEGQVLTTRCRPLAGAWLDFWHAEREGSNRAGTNRTIERTVKERTALAAEAASAGRHSRCAAAGRPSSP